MENGEQRRENFRKFFVMVVVQGKILVITAKAGIGTMDVVDTLKNYVKAASFTKHPPCKGLIPSPGQGVLAVALG